MSNISELINATKITTSASQKEAVCQTSAYENNVNHPQHYQSKTGLEAIDVIEAFDLNFNLGNAIKYILRCGKKDQDIQELAKAKWYIEREICNRGLAK